MVEVHSACTKGDVFSDVDGMAGDSCRGGVRRVCNRYTSEERSGQNVRRCAPCESQEVNQLLPGCTHYLSSLE